MAKRKQKIFPFPVIPGTEVMTKDAPSWRIYPHHDVPYGAPSSVEDYKKYKRAEEFWENEGMGSKFSEKYLRDGKYIYGKDAKRYKEKATLRAGEFEDPALQSRFWAPDENIDEIFRRQKGKKRKAVRKRRKLAKKKLSGKKRKKKYKQRSKTY